MQERKKMNLDVDEIKVQLKPLIISSLRITEVSPEQMDDNMRLLDGDFEIDSVDILQLIIDIEKKFDIKLVSGRFDRNAWQSVNTLAEAIKSKMQQSSTK
jgi:acyl carrier protein